MWQVVEEMSKNEQIRLIVQDKRLQLMYSIKQKHQLLNYKPITEDTLWK